MIAATCNPASAAFSCVREAASAPYASSKWDVLTQRVQSWRLALGPLLEQGRLPSETVALLASQSLAGSCSICVSGLAQGRSRQSLLWLNPQLKGHKFLPWLMENSTPESPSLSPLAPGAAPRVLGVRVGPVHCWASGFGWGLCR